MPTVTDEASLPQAVDELYRAVAALVDPRKQFLNGRVLAGPSCYESLLAAIPAKSSGDTFSRGVGRSLPTVWCDAVDLRADIDGRVKDWRPQGDSTPQRLRGLASSRWRPQDAAQVRRYAAETLAWVSAIWNLIDPPSVKDVGAACPSCGRRWFYRNRDGEEIRQPALQLVTATGCSCQACGAHWPPDRYLWLCKLLGFDVPAGVLE
jgi:hypothetical protein